MADAMPPTIEETTPDTAVVVPTFPDEVPPSVASTPPTVPSAFSTPPTPPKKSNSKGFWAGVGIVIAILGIVWIVGRTVPSVHLTLIPAPTPTIVSPLTTPTPICLQPGNRDVQIVCPTPTATASATPTATPSAAVRYSLPTPTVHAK